MIVENNDFKITINEDHLQQIDIYNSNTEVGIELSSGFSLTVIVGTPSSLQHIMEENEVNFYGPGLTWIFVKKLTKDVILEAVKAYMDDKPEGYWLKLYHFVYEIDPAIFNTLRDQEIKIEKESREELEKTGCKIIRREVEGRRTVYTLVYYSSAAKPEGERY